MNLNLSRNGSKLKFGSTWCCVDVGWGVGVIVVIVEVVEVDGVVAERVGRRVVVGREEAFGVVDEDGRGERDEEDKEEDDACCRLEGLELGVDVAYTVAVSNRVEVS